MSEEKLLLPPGRTGQLFEWLCPPGSWRLQAKRDRNHVGKGEKQNRCVLTVGRCTDPCGEMAGGSKGLANSGEQVSIPAGSSFSLTDSLDDCRGIALGVVLGAVFWAGVGFGIWCVVS